MNFQDLKMIITKLEPGMTISVPRSWIDKIIPGPDMERDIRLFSLAPQLECNINKVGDRVVFERHPPID